MNDNLNNFETEFLLKSNSYSVNEDSLEAANFLNQSLRSKAVSLPNMTISFKKTLPLIGADICQKIALVLQGLSSVNAPSIISMRLLQTLSEIPPSSDFSYELLTDTVVKMWREIEPDCLGTLLHSYSMDVPVSDIFSHALNMWRSGNLLKAIKLCKEFNFSVFFNQSRLENEEEAISALISKQKPEFIKIFVSKNLELAKKAVSIMIPHRGLLKHAVDIVSDNGLNYEDFPDLVMYMKKRSLGYHIMSGKVGIYNLADIASTETDLLKIMIEMLVTDSKKDNALWKRQAAANIIDMYPEVYPLLSPEILQDLMQIQPKKNRLPDYFGPLQPEMSLSLRLPQEYIFFIDSEETLLEINLQGEIVGLDSEWKPTLVDINPQVALLQIGFENRVYLIDMIKLGSSPVLDAKLTEMFSNPNILKLGIAFDGDMKNLRKSYKKSECFKNNISNYIDLLDFYKEIYNETPGGLAGLCELVLDTHLCKAQQMSNWERRPLRLAQMHYASLDAFVLIDIYKELWTKSQAKDTQSKALFESSCKNCRSKLHQTDDCPKGSKCKLCQKFGHSESECPN